MTGDRDGAAGVGAGGIPVEVRAKNTLGVARDWGAEPCRRWPVAGLGGNIAAGDLPPTTVRVENWVWGRKGLETTKSIKSNIEK